MKLGIKVNRPFRSPGGQNYRTPILRAASRHRRGGKGKGKGKHFAAVFGVVGHLKPAPYQHFLNEALQTQVKGRKLIGALCTFPNLAGALEIGGVSRIEAQQFAEQIDLRLRRWRGAFMARYSSILPVLAKTMETSAALIVCVTHKDTQHLETPVLLMNMQPAFPMVPFGQTIPEKDRDGWIRFSKDPSMGELESKMILVLHAKPGDMLLGRLTRTMACLCNYADFILMKRWLNANLELIRSGKDGDNLFQNHVRLQARKLEVDEGFVRAFIIARGYAIRGPTLDPDDDIMTRMLIEPGHRESALKDMRLFAGVTARVLEIEGVTEGNVLDLADRWGRTMLNTIDQAGKLAP